MWGIVRLQVYVCVYVCTKSSNTFLCYNLQYVPAGFLVVI